MFRALSFSVIVGLKTSGKMSWPRPTSPMVLNSVLATSGTVFSLSASHSTPVSLNRRLIICFLGEEAPETELVSEADWEIEAEEPATLRILAPAPGRGVASGSNSALVPSKRRFFGVDVILFSSSLREAGGLASW